jgi:hypothetical protein
MFKLGHFGDTQARDWPRGPGGGGTVPTEPGVRGRACATTPLPSGASCPQVHRLAQQLRGAGPPPCQEGPPDNDMAVSIEIFSFLFFVLILICNGF